MAKMSEQVTYEERAREIIKLHDAGLSRKEIAQRLGYKLSYLSPRITSALENREYFSQKIDLDGLQIKTKNCLCSAGIHSDEELVDAIKQGKIYHGNGWTNFGQKCVDDIARFAKERLGLDVSKYIMTTPEIKPLKVEGVDASKAMIKELKSLIKKIENGEATAVSLTKNSVKERIEKGHRTYSVPTTKVIYRVTVDLGPVDLGD